ncbi:MAG: outer membrane protein transport protein [Myxococcota bacterium]|nr:outer membrane protein transport protein [Myxococcota bacterium]
MLGRCAFLTCLLAPVLPIWANPIDAFGIGARSTALGGAVSATPRDATSSYYNPAGLAPLRRIRLDLGYHHVTPRLQINDGDQAVTESRGLQGGLSLPFKLVEHNATFGLLLHLPDERISRIRALPERMPRWVLWDNRPQRILISSAFGVQIYDGLSIGAGLTYLANTAATVQMQGFVHLDDAGQTFLDSAVDAELKAVRYWNAGLLFQSKNGWSVAANWRQSFRLKLDLGVDVTGDIGFDMSDPIVKNGAFNLFSTNANLFSPQQVYIGVAYTIQAWTIAFDLGWLQWSAFPTPTAKVSVVLDLDPLDFELPTPEAPLEPNFADIWVPRLGIEWDAYTGQRVGFTLRMGYFYEPTPAPEQKGRTNYVDGDKHGLSTGIGMTLQDASGLLPQPMEIGLSGQWLSLPDRRHVKDDYSDPVGDYVGGGNSWGLFSTVSLVF